MKTKFTALKMLFSFLFIFLLQLTGFSQSTYDENFGGNNEDQLTSFTVLKNELMILTGKTFPVGAGTVDINCVAVGKAGNMLWSKHYDTELSVDRIKCASTSDNGFLLYASLGFGGTEGTVIMKCNKNGDVIWSKKIKSADYVYHYPVGIFEDVNGGIVFVCSKYPLSFDSSIIGAARFDSQSRIAWQTSVYVSPSHSLELCTATENGGFAVGGRYTDDFNGYVSPSLLLFNSTGNPVAIKSISLTNRLLDDKTYLRNVYGKNNRFTVLGYYYGNDPEKYFFFSFDTADVKARADMIIPTAFALQNYYQKNVNARGITMDRITNSYLAKDDGLVLMSTANYGIQNTNFHLQKFDSLGRICPAYELPRINTNITRKSFSITNGTYKLVSDNLILEDISVNVADLSDQNITCTGSAAILNSVTASALINGKTETENAAAATLYPNPAKNFIMVKFNVAAASEVNIEIVSAQGKVVTSKKDLFTAGRYERTINIQSLPPGVYFTRITINGNKQTVLKFIKE